MTAGTAATRDEFKPNSHVTNPTLPYEPRKLTRSERNRRELFVFHSPRNARIVTVTEFLHLTLALQLEFDPNLQSYVERPRRIALSPRQDIDISFWTRSKQGEERYYLAIPASGTIGSTSGIVSIREQEALDAAAERHGLRLIYITERELISSIADCAVRFELLHHVWAYQRLVTRSTIQDQILALLTNRPRLTLSGLIQHLAVDADSVRAVVAGMVHAGRLRLVDYTAGSAQATVEVCHAH
ncbi:hypothetical protein [Xanthomonas sp. 3498]|uniref:hypothetical protein n=1 Tax=Xanthomonas sp. 3498 TaxID=2663863 RepID=UPI0016094D66|nr:hypothetical protein [Xanthomonas sp. 3498]MBB5876303.1 hypothetical protein [Xanthomonas sp. 3498]